MVLLGRLIGGSEVGGREVSLVKAGGSFGSLGAFYGSSGKGLWFFERLLWFIGRCFGSLGDLIPVSVMLEVSPVEVIQIVELVLEVSVVVAARPRGPWWLMLP